jgi:MFS transporter, PAT family, beta-lactamase induction signal transducer AmpG
VLRTPASLDARSAAPTGATPAAARPWTWVPTLYFAEGVPNALVVAVSVILYKELGLSNTQIALFTSWLYLPWVIKPLWSPVVDILSTRRLWIWTMQLTFGAALAGIALTLPTARFVQFSLAFFWLLAFSSATHDIAADGFYMLALSERDQSWFIGIRNTCYRIATLCMQGALVVLAGLIQNRTGNRVLAWEMAFAVLAGLLFALGLYHGCILPKPTADASGNSNSLRQFLWKFLATFRTFFQKPKIITILLFLLVYRFAEAQLLKMVSPFLLDSRNLGGLGLSAEEVGFLYGTIGVIALMLGGILGGVLVSKHGLRAWLWPMVVVMHLPDAVFLYLSSAQPQNLLTIGSCLALEQFGYGFGFAAYMLYMIYIARGLHQTAHYAICTGFMALGLMLPGMWSGWLQEHLGYPHFFLWVLAATLPGFVVAALIPLDAEFGRREAR